MTEHLETTESLPFNEAANRLTLRQAEVEGRLDDRLNDLECGHDRLYAQIATLRAVVSQAAGIHALQQQEIETLKENLAALKSKSLSERGWLDEITAVLNFSEKWRTQIFSFVAAIGIFAFITSLSADQKDKLADRLLTQESIASLLLVVTGGTIALTKKDSKPHG